MVETPQDDTAEVQDAAPEGTDAPESSLPKAEDVAANMPQDENGKTVAAILGLKMDVRVVLGRSKMPIGELLELTKGSVIELDRKVGEPVDVMINDRTVARGDLVRVKDDLLGVALREIVKDISFDE
ncbi:MAG: FliM/FliN family flagellar motor switch protein [Rhodobacteraceae bacterium]|nr:FliM/FliN family flagellar motor switch protein [Paracoccaceae bacterium]